MTAGSLQQRFVGRLFLPQDEGYDQARVNRVYNGRRHDQQPAAILKAASEADVVAGLDLARERGWSLTIRSGGHSYPMWSVRRGALLLDLGAYKEMSYDQASGIVTATSACEGGRDLNTFLAPYGRFFAGGLCSSVGIGGFLLQGGLGWNFRGWGWACEAVEAVDVLTADGQMLRADQHQNTDLYWAARGCGPLFPGLVLRFHIRTRPLPGAMISTQQVFPLGDYADILQWLGQAQTTMPKDVHLMAMTSDAVASVPDTSNSGADSPVAGDPDAGTSGMDGYAETDPRPDDPATPASPASPETGEEVFVIWATAFADSDEQALAALEPLEANPHLPKALWVKPPAATSIAAEYAFTDRAEPAGKRYRVDSAWVTGEPHEVARAARVAVLERPGPGTGYTFFQWALPRPTPDMAASLSTELMVGTFSICEDATDDERHNQWMFAAMTPLQPFTVGQYWGDSDQQRREVKCLGDDAWTRLQTIRQHRDPDERFGNHPTVRGQYCNQNGWETALPKM